MVEYRRSITCIQSDLYVCLRCSGDLWGAFKDVAADDSAVNSLAEVNVWLVQAKLASPDKDGPRTRLNCGAVSGASPLHESAVAETHGTFTGDLCNLIAGPPKGTIAKANNAVMSWTYLHHRRVGSME